MRKFPKPVVVLSKCLEFEACRYNGQLIPDPFVRRLKPHLTFLPICPEVEIGLGTPRDPIHIVSLKGEERLIQPTTELDLSEKMNRFSEDFLSSLKEVDGFLLKSRSPSCGMKDVKVYRREVKGAIMRERPGFFAAKVLENFPGLAIEEEGRLRNLRIREHFLTKLYTLAQFREVRRSKSMKTLVRFHTINKFLLMAYSQKELKSLGNIVANREKKLLTDVLRDYEKHLKEAFVRLPRYTSNINVLTRSLGYFSKELSRKEKSFFLESLEKYRKNKIPLSSVISIVRSWIVRFDISYLADQTFFEAFPEDLIEAADSGKGRDLES